jgi:hypothetical protein
VQAALCINGMQPFLTLSYWSRNDWKGLTTIKIWDALRDEARQEPGW